MATRDGVFFTRGNIQDVSAQAGQQEMANDGKVDFLRLDVFRVLIYRFFMTYTADNGMSFMYKDLITGLLDQERSHQSKQTATSEVTSFTMDLAHLTHYTTWDVRGEAPDDVLSDVASTLLESVEAPSHMLVADNLYNCLSVQPLRYIPIVEDLVTHIYNHLTQEELNVFQLDVADSRRTATNLRSLQAPHMDKFVLVPGIVVGVTKVTMKAINVRAKCKKCQKIIFLKIPHWKGSANLPKTCPSNERGGADGGQKCPTNSYEIVCEWTEYLETQLAKFQELPEDVPIGDMPRHVSLSMTGIHSRSLVPGQRVYVLGIYSSFDTDIKSFRSQNKKKGSNIHVMGVFNHPDENISAKALFGGTEDVSALNFNETEINAFREMSKNPDIIDIIGRSIAPGIFGLDMVKRSVACLLFGGSRKAVTDGTKLRGDTHILLLGDPSVAKSQVLKFACQVSRRGVYTSGKGTSAAGLTAAIVKDQQGNFALEGGAMVLADGGVVAIDEFDKMRDDDRVAIHEAMEQQTISIAKAGINTVLNSKCSVLAAANPTFGSFDRSLDTAEQHDFETTILSRFDLIWPIFDDKDYDKDKNIADHIFGLYAREGGKKVATDDQVVTDIMEDKDGNKIFHIEFLKKYITYSRHKIHPRLNAASVNRLENYYVEVRENSRSCNQNRVDKVPITIRQLESLIRLSESFAKMALSETVLPNHVDMAIKLFDNATVEASKSAIGREILTEEERDKVEEAESAILRRVAINARASKFTIVRDLQTHGIENKFCNLALRKLIKDGTFMERKDASVMRVQ